MSQITPAEVELMSHFNRHLGPKFEAAGLRGQFHYNQEPGIHCKSEPSVEYRAAILAGLQEGMALRFPDFSSTASLWVTEVIEHEVESSQQAFYKAAQLVIEQAYL